MSNSDINYQISIPNEYIDISQKIKKYCSISTKSNNLKNIGAKKFFDLIDIGDQFDSFCCNERQS